jgi:hypothetical protein
MPFDALPAEVIPDLGLDPTTMLEALHARIAKRDTWHADAYAYHRTNNAGVESHCLVGWVDAVLAEKLDELGPDSMPKLKALSRQMLLRIYAQLPPSARRRRDVTRSVISYNDTHQHAAVVRLVGRAAAV